MRHSAAALFFCSFASVASAQSSTDTHQLNAGAEYVADVFLAKCVDPLLNYTNTVVDGLVRFTKLEIENLEDSMGQSFDGLKLWSDKQGRLVLVLRETSEPNPCTVFTYKLSPDAAQLVWNRIAQLDGFQVGFPLEIEEEQEVEGKLFRDNGGGAIHLKGADFLQIHENYIGNPETGLVILTTARVPSSPWACELFPEHCDSD